jgi:prepilin-type N-terminal cleavage/methylation domain-containing protein
MHKHKHLLGFTLLEMSIVLMIVSVIIGGGLLIFNKYSAKSKVVETEEKIKIILSAIKQYALKYNRLPCPTVNVSSQAVPLGHFDFGMENTTGTPVTGCTGGFYHGTVPVHTLHLYPTLANDAWDRRFKYVVRRNYVVTNGLTTNASPDDILLYNGVNTRLYPDVVVAIISHGENGLGSFSGRGGAASATTGATATEIANANNAINGDAVALYAYPPAGGYDDVVGFWTFDQIKNADLME